MVQKTEITIGLKYHKLKQALLNIVINACQSMENSSSKELFVSTYQNDKSQVCVEIQDTGLGISKDGLRKIFEPFHTTKPKGTGLGLAITHKILESHQASIEVESEVGTGTRFILKFPLEVK